MTNIIASLFLSGLAGSAVVATVGLSGDTTVPIKEAAVVSIAFFCLLLRIDHHFSKLNKKMDRNRSLEKQKTLWYRTSIHLINKHLGLENIPFPKDEENTTTI